MVCELWRENAKTIVCGKCDALGAVERRTLGQNRRLPFLAEESVRLATALTDAKTLNAEQEALKAQLQAVTQRLEAKVTALTEQESRLRASLKGKYGAKNEVLEAFGIKPSKTPVRKKATG